MKRQAGFTLIEIIAVLTMILLIMTITVPRLAKVVDQQRLKADAVTALEISKTAELWYAENKFLGNSNKTKLNDYIEESFGEQPTSQSLIDARFTCDVDANNGMVNVSLSKDSKTWQLVKKGKLSDNALNYASFQQFFSE